MKEKFLEQIIKKVTGKIDGLNSVVTRDNTEIIISSKGYEHLIDYGTLLCLEELIAMTLYYYERSHLTDEDIERLNSILAFEKGNGFSTYDNCSQDKEVGFIKKMKKGLRTKIYVIRDARSSSIKVGKSIDPKSRLKEHQTSNSNRLELVYEFNGYERDEKLIHLKLKAAGFHIHGEWFKDNEEALDSVRKHFE